MQEQYVNGEIILWDKADAQKENRNRAVREINSQIAEACERGKASLTIKKDGLPKGLLEELKKNFNILGETIDNIIISWEEEK